MNSGRILLAFRYAAHMLAVYHRRGPSSRSRWRYRTCLLAALLLFCVVQVAIMVVYYNRITSSREQHAAGTAEGTASIGRRVGASAAGALTPGSPRRRYITRKEQERLLQQSSNLDPARVKWLRERQLQASEELAAGRPPPVISTHIFPPGNENGACVGQGPPDPAAVAAVVVVTFNRAKYLEQMLDSLFEVHGKDKQNRHKFPLYVSQDFSAEGVQDVVAARLESLSYLQHAETKPPQVADKKEKVVYYRIANHYKFIMRTFFDCFGYDRLIILEDDMTLSPDFFSYFEATAPLLDSDPSLFCVSSWNDHGQDRFVHNATQLYRSDFFPGLGWMLNRRVWHSVRDSWPAGYWDDHMRLNSTRQGRQCIRPEVCRTYNFGDIGSSSGQYFRLFLRPIKLNSEEVDWQRLDLSYLQKDKYQQLFEAELAAAQVLQRVEEVPNCQPGRDYVVRYNSQQSYEAITGKLRMMREWKDGVPRGAYRGTVAVRNLVGARIFIAPTPDVNFSAARFNPSNKLRVDNTGAVVRRRNGTAVTREGLLASRQRLQMLRQEQQQRRQQQQQVNQRRQQQVDERQQNQQQQHT